MKDEIRNKLILNQKKLVRDLEAWKSMQTNFNFGSEWYDLCEFKIYQLDVEIDIIRRVLEMG